ncbi:hypothetical protein KGF56_004135 [Candida oxycetoniae]|uniref:Uncharacterized protein n=1 Tax=Candida oxycetoniae TaxID=497107 RepID=A0AAI9SUE0_9ASCO|nr:uncharacterized protein KGF56_004135 [Candida oxycetoniae]KAI3403075.1 hypothetical protein KGF56_004135 [Candida oxycetoniae]
MKLARQISALFDGWMLQYIAEQALSIENFVVFASKQGFGHGYIVVADPVLYNEDIVLPQPSPSVIRDLYGVSIVLIESWHELYEFIGGIQEPCVIAFYGIFKRFLETGSENVSTCFLKMEEFCGYQVNKFLHELFVLHLNHKVQVLMTDSMQRQVLDEISIPRVRDQVLVKSELFLNRRLKEEEEEEDQQEEDQQETKISLVLILYKWCEILESSSNNV